MKRYLIIILICLIGISSSGCAVSQVLENKADNQKHAEEVSKELIRCINERDLDFLDYIDGEIEDYDFNYRGEISSSIRDGKWTRQETQTKLENIITDTGKKYYQITFSEYVICTEEKDKEGISILTLHDENNKLLCRICYM